MPFDELQIAVGRAADAQRRRNRHAQAIAEAMQLPSARCGRRFHVDAQTMLAQHQRDAGAKSCDAVDRRVVDVRRCAFEDDHARTTFVGLDAHVKVADVFAGNHQVVIEVAPHSDAAGQRETRIGLVEQHQRISHVGHSKQYCTRQAAPSAPKLSSPAPRMGSFSRLTKCGRVSSVGRTKLPFVL